MPVFGLLTMLAVLITLYFVPTMVGCRRAHHQAPAICVLNLLLGWTVLGWIIALMWAVSAIPPASRTVETTPRQDALATTPAVTAFDRVRAWPSL